MNAIKREAEEQKRQELIKLFTDSGVIEHQGIKVNHLSLSKLQRLLRKAGSASES